MRGGLEVAALHINSSLSVVSKQACGSEGRSMRRSRGGIGGQNPTA